MNEKHQASLCAYLSVADAWLERLQDVLHTIDVDDQELVNLRKFRHDLKQVMIRHEY